MLPNEINNVVDSFEVLKMTRCVDVKAKFIKLSELIIFFLCKSINNCSSKGVYANFLKIAKAIPRFEKIIQLLIIAI